MPTLADLRGFDAGQFIQMGQAGQRQRTLADIGQAASTGDFRGAQSAAFAGGENDIGMKLKQMNDQDQMQLVEQAASWAYDANDPQKWEAGRQMWQAKGFDPGPFQARNVLLSQAQTVQQKMAQANADRTAGMEQQKMAQAGATAQNDKFYGVPVPYRNQDGSIGYGLPSKQGEFHPLDAPNGSTFLTQQDIASQRAQGKGEGEAMVAYRSMQSKLPSMEKVVGDLNKLADEATYTTGGQIVNQFRTELGMAPTDAAVARTKYISMVDNQILPLLRDTFGAAFTVKEGESLRATLGDPNKTPAEKKAVLESFIEQKKRDVQALAEQAAPQQQGGPRPPQGQPPQQGGPVDWQSYFGKQ
jgi:hypothetical protein